MTDSKRIPLMNFYLESNVIKYNNPLAFFKKFPRTIFEQTFSESNPYLFFQKT